MPPVFAMPVIRPRPGSGYTNANDRFTLGPVRTIPGPTSPGRTPPSDGLAIEINNLLESAHERLIYAITKGYVVFGYQRSAPPAAEPFPKIRAVFMLHPSIHAGDLGARPTHQLHAVHEDHSLGKVNEAFRSLTWIEFENLDLARTKQAVLELVRQAQGRGTEPAAQWTLSSPRPRAHAQTLAQWLAVSGHTAEAFVDELFAHARLNRLSGDRPAQQATSVTGLHVSAGEAFGAAAILGDTPPTTPTMTFAVTIRFFDSSREVVNPFYFFNALVKRRDEIDFLDDAHYGRDVGGGSGSNKLGIPALLGSIDDPSQDRPPAALAQCLHPLLWNMSLGSMGVFARQAGMPVTSAPFPPFFIASASAPVYHSDYDRHRIDLTATGLGVFHGNRRRILSSTPGFATDPIAVAATDPGDPTLLEGSRYQWRVNEDGYLVYRTGGSSPQDDEWYPPFNSLSDVRTIWEQQGDSISRFSLQFGIPCELFVAIAAKEGGADGVTNIGLEPWLPPPAGYENRPPYENRLGLETIPPSELLASHMTVPGIKYLFLTNVWNPSINRWQGKDGRGGTRSHGYYSRDGHLDVRIRYGRVEGTRLIRMDDQRPPELRDLVLEYRWEELLHDLDHFGPSQASADEPPDAVRGMRYAARLDRRISPGATQNMIAFVPPERDPLGRPDMLGALEVMNGEAGARAALAALRSEGFFDQRHDFTGTTNDILLAATDPSYRFLWLCNASHNALCTFARWTNGMRGLRSTTDPRHAERGILQPDNDLANPPPGAPNYETFRYSNENDIRDPMIVVALHGGAGDLKRFNSVASFGIYMIGDGGRNRWTSMPPKFNACVRLFERYEEFGSGGLPLPSVRYARRRT